MVRLISSVYLVHVILKDCNFPGRNNLQKPDTIDVHGLKPDEALFRTEERLRHLLRNGHSTLNVIVGKGLHSPNGVPAVKNHIVREMQRYDD